MQDPYLILGVSRATTDEEVRQAYLAAIRNCPPDRDAERFRFVQRAYDTIKCRRSRLEQALFDTELPDPEELLTQALSQSESIPARPTVGVIQGVIRNGFKATSGWR